MKKPVLLLSSALISTSIFVSSPAFASENKSNVEPYSHSEVIEKNVPKEVRDAVSNRKIEVSKTNNYNLTEADLKNVDLNKLANIYQELKDDINSGQYTIEELNTIVAEKIKSQGVKVENNNQTIFKADAVEEAEDPYVDVPGLGKLSTAEIELALNNPAEFAVYSLTAAEAKLLADSSGYSEASLYQGNGDAFRHTYWNAIMVIEFGQLHDNSVEAGYDRTRIWGDAHETMSEGIDKEMDLYNNGSGRFIGWFDFESDRSTIRSIVTDRVEAGSLCRIVNDRLVATNSDKNS